MGGIVETSASASGGGGFPVTAFRFVVSDAAGNASALPVITAAIPFYSVNTGHPAVNANLTYHDDANQLVVGGASPQVSLQGTSGITELSIFDLGNTEALLALSCNSTSATLALDPSGNTNLTSSNNTLNLTTAGFDVKLGDNNVTKYLTLKATTGNVLINKTADNGVDQLQVTGTIFSFNSAAPVGLHMSVGGVLANVIEDAAGNLNLSNSANANGIVLSVGGRALVNTLTDDGSNTLQVNGSLKASSVTIPGLTATRVPFAGSGGTLADSANFIFTVATPSITVGSGTTTSTGAQIGYLGSTGLAGIQRTGDAFDSSHFRLAFDATTTYLNAPSAQIELRVNNAAIVKVLSSNSLAPGTDGSQSLGNSTNRFSNTFSNIFTLNSSGPFLVTQQSLTNNAAAQIATITNGPLAGNPTKWIAINDNGTTRNIPCW